MLSSMYRESRYYTLNEMKLCKRQKINPLKYSYILKLLNFNLFFAITVIGTLYCAKGNFEFGISRIIKVRFRFISCQLIDTSDPSLSLLFHSLFVSTVPLPLCLYCFTPYFWQSLSHLSLFWNFIRMLGILNSWPYSFLSEDFLLF